MLASVVIYFISWTPKEVLRLLCFLQIVNQNPSAVRLFVLFQALTTLHSLVSHNYSHINISITAGGGGGGGGGVRGVIGGRGYEGSDGGGGGE